MKIKKYSGDLVEFDRSRLRHSLERSGAPEDLISKVVENVEAKLVDGMTTREIYSMAFSLLRKHARPSAARYNLKRALLQFGPSGFPFEKFIAHLLDLKGFKTQTGQMVPGHCVSHEVDVIAEKEQKHFMVECKFHGDQARKCDVKIPLYIQSRFKDIEKEWRKRSGHETKFHQGWLVTNTRFTTDAIQYGQCMELHLMSWDYPVGNSLKDWIDETGAHPVTSLTTLTGREKKALLDKGIVLCRHLCESTTVLDVIGISQTRRKKILQEAQVVCSYNNQKVN